LAQSRKPSIDPVIVGCDYYFDVTFAVVHLNQIPPAAPALRVFVFFFFFKRQVFLLFTFLGNPAVVAGNNNNGKK
jgi:hypothetical protein